MNNNYTKAYKEISEILRYVSKDDIEKIPLDILNMIEEMKDNDYDFHFDINKGVEEQNLLTETKSILIILFRDYWATSEQKEEIKKNHNDARNKLEIEKQKKYNSNEIFKNKPYDKKETKEVALEIIKKEKWYKRILNYFRRYWNI